MAADFDQGWVGVVGLGDGGHVEVGDGAGPEDQAVGGSAELEVIAETNYTVLAGGGRVGPRDCPWLPGSAAADRYRRIR